VNTGTTKTRARALPMVALSLALHGAAWAAVARVRPAPARERIEVEVVRRERAAPPAEPPPARPRVAVARPEAVPARPLPAPIPEAPPPALASAQATPPPPGAPRALPKVGLSLGSTVSTGGFAVGVGNTVYGRAAERAADPASVRKYAGGVVAAARLSAQPKVLALPQIPYPPEARRAGVEGQVVLVLRVDALGAVRGVRVVDAPSPELARAAEEGARRFRFTPALLEGEPVETEIRFTYNFLLE
jgi:protein TonB